MLHVPSTTDHSGWLSKKGEGNTAFKNRWFVLTQKTLTYFENEKATKEKGSIDLTCATFDTGEQTKTGFRLTITVLTSGNIGRTYVLEAKEEASRDLWLSKLMLASVKQTQNVRVFPEGTVLDQVVGPCPNTRTWRQEWVGMRMEELRLNGNAQLANRKDCGENGCQSLENWANMRGAAVQWKKDQGWDPEHALAYTLLGGCNRGALARCVRERSGQYAASLHLISRALAARVADPAPDVYYHLCGRNGLAVSDSAWAALLEPDAKPGLKVVITSNAVGRDDPGCFPIDASKACSGFHDKYLAGRDATGATLYSYCLIAAPVVKFVSAPSSKAAGHTVHHTVVRVDGEGHRWEMPPLSTITLKKIDPPGTWGAFQAEKVMRTLYTVEVAWTASAGGDGSDDGSDDDGVLVPDASKIEIN